MFNMFNFFFFNLNRPTNKKNFKWVKGIENNFKLIEKMLNEITLYKRRRTMPQTFKDHSHNTLFFN
jgi:hypothetical protein